MKTITLITLSFIAVSSQARADTVLPFSSVWKTARQESSDLSAVNHEVESSKINQERMARHWYPRVYMDARAFSTNDPAINFMSLLGQRQITNADFAPSSLNQPGSNFYEHGTLGIDFPLYEGGAKTAMAKASDKQADAKALELSATEIALYANIATGYASILSLAHQKKELDKLAENIKHILVNYRVGSKSNPVGYSGLLGLKSLQNRVLGLLNENFAKTQSLRATLEVTAKKLPQDWQPEMQSTKNFIHNSLYTRTTSSTEANTAVQSMYKNGEAMADLKAAEKARFLPKIGLFGNGDLYNGSRASATSFAAGAYLQWDLFSATNYGAVDQAEHSAAAAFARADAARERSQIAKNSAEESLQALESNLSLLQDSDQLLAEQTESAKLLFQNGSINALQFVEVLARKIDLTVNRTEAEFALAQTSSTLFVNSAEGVSHEN